MNKKINIFSSIDLSMLGDELDFLKKKTNLSFSLDSTYKKIVDADIYISSAKIKVDKKFLNKSKNLRLILSPSTGTDHLDMNEIKKRKIKNEIRLWFFDFRDWTEWFFFLQDQC